MLDIALFEPQIAPNTGNIIRLVANNGFRLHLIEPMGFDLDEKKLRRAGLDYGDMAHVTVHTDYWSFKEKFQARRMIACTTKGRGSHAAMKYQLDDILLFGAETHGLSPEVMADIAEANRVKIPMKHGNRSLNLSNAVAIISYEAWRQHDFIGAGE